MEKIYMNENGSSNNKKVSKLHISIVLSFVVAIFAMVSLVVVGFNRVSYAAPASTTSSFKLAKFGKKNASTDVNPIEPVYVTSFNGSSSCSAGVKGYAYELMYIDRGSYASATVGQYVDNISDITPVFCVGTKSTTAGFESTYTRNSAMTDKGIAYILGKSNLYNSSSSIIPTGTGGANYKFLEAYATQAALWIYLNDPLLVSNGTVINDIKNASGYALDDRANDDTCTSSTVIYSSNLYSYISTVVEGAKSAALSGATKSISVSLDSTVSDVEGTDLVQTSEIKVTGNPSNDLKYYSLSIEGIEGAYVVDKDGNKVENLTNLSPSTKYFVRFEKVKTADEKKTLTVSVSGTFKEIVPYLYKSSGKQDIAYYDVSDKVVNDSTPIEVVGPPDTGMSTSQTIYFIGLIVLLCGVGIIYANSKPLKGI